MRTHLQVVVVELLTLAVRVGVTPSSQEAWGDEPPARVAVAVGAGVFSCSCGEGGQEVDQAVDQGAWEAHASCLVVAGVGVAQGVKDQGEGWVS